ncbi:MAG: molybdopterin-dependent oxidoreductase, partial [Alphaproteobacteria bacterium]|nr:molybdopterin-dependent oxidoreductase [Alphaproteobacteria bacterium]
VQVLAEKLEMDPADISVGYADSDKGFNSSGPGGSRFTVMIAGAVSGAADAIKEKMLRVASHMLEADPSDLEFRAGSIGVQGVPGKEKTLAEVALHAHYFRLDLPEDHDLTSGIDAAYVYDHPVTTMPWHLLPHRRPHVSHPGGGGGCRDRQDRLPRLRGGARLRHHGQPDDAGRPRARRHGERHRQRALRALPLRRERPVAERAAQRLPAPDPDGDAGGHPRRPRGDALALHRVRHQGRRRGRAHGRAPGHRRGGGGRAQAPRHQGRLPPAHPQDPARHDPRGGGEGGLSAPLCAEAC